MQITVSDHVAGAAAERGVAVIIDVFRAASLQCYAMGRGAAKIVPVAEIERARELKRVHPDWLLAGERHGRMLAGFEQGNSPSDIARLDLAGRTLIHTTHAGTQGLAAARDAAVVLCAALVNAGATARYIRRLRPASVSLVRMGSQGRERTAEDDVCAEWLGALLRGEPYDTAAIAPRLRASPAAQKFFDPACDWAPEADFAHCLALDRFDFALRLEGRDSAIPYLAARNPT